MIGIHLQFTEINMSKEITESLNYRIFANSLHVALELYIEQLEANGEPFPINFEEASSNVMNHARQLYGAVAGELRGITETKDKREKELLSG